MQKSHTFYVDDRTPTVMLEIYKVVPILKKLPFDIESLHAHDDYLVVGTKQGHLLMYKLQPKTTADGKFDVKIQRSNKAFSKKPIVQIEALPDFHILISLSDNQVSVHDLEPYNAPVRTCNLLAAKCRGAVMFVTNVHRYTGLTGEQTPVLRLCVALKRKLLLFYWKNQDFHELATDLAIPDTPRAMAWVSESLCIGFRSEYVLIKVTGEQKELFPLGKHPEPVVAALDQNRLLALGRDEKSYILDPDGNPILSYDISWSDYPHTIVDDMPYLLCLQPNSVIEVQTMEPPLVVQKMSDFSSERIKLMIRCVNKKGQTFAASDHDIFCIVAVPYSQQIQLLLQENQFELARQLASAAESDEALAIQSSATPSALKKEDTIKHIEHRHAFFQFCNKEFKESMNRFSKLDVDPSLVIGLFPDILPEKSLGKLDYPSPPPQLDAQELKAGLTALIDYLLPVRSKLAGTDDSSSGRPKSQLRQIVDTTLLKCYLQTNDALVASLLRLPDNHCHLEEAEQALKKHNKLNELLILYQSKGIHRKALDMLTKECKQPTSKNFSYERIINYLQHLGPEHVNLIFEYSPWILKEYPDDGLRIFTEEFGSETENLPRAKVIDFLQQINPNLVAPYLEHVITQWKDQTASFHNMLIYKYREKVSEKLPVYLNSLPEGHIPASPGTEPGDLGIVREKLLQFLVSSDHYSTEVLPFDFERDGLWHEKALVMGKIGDHREALKIYIHQLNDPETAESYCNRVYDKSIPGNREVYLTLVQLLLSQSDIQRIRGNVSDDSQRLELAIGLLNKHPQKVDPIQTLLLLPPGTAIAKLKHFLEIVTKHTQKERKAGQIFRNLLRSQHLQIQGQRIRIQQSHKIIIEDYDLCRSCQKRIGKTAFLRYPNAHLVHYYCKDSYNARSS